MYTKSTVQYDHAGGGGGASPNVHTVQRNFMLQPNHT